MTDICSYSTFGLDSINLPLRRSNEAPMFRNNKQTCMHVSLCHCVSPNDCCHCVNDALVVLVPSRNKPLTYTPSAGDSFISSLLWRVIWFCNTTESNAQPLCALVTSYELQTKPGTESNDVRSYLQCKYIYTYLPHGRQETLRVEKSSHPKYLTYIEHECLLFTHSASTWYGHVTHFGSIGQKPRTKLCVPLQQFGVPKSKCCRFPWNLHKRE